MNLYICAFSITCVIIIGWVVAGIVTYVIKKATNQHR